MYCIVFSLWAFKCASVKNVFLKWTPPKSVHGKLWFKRGQTHSGSLCMEVTGVHCSLHFKSAMDISWDEYISLNMQLWFGQSDSQWVGAIPCMYYYRYNGAALRGMRSTSPPQGLQRLWTPPGHRHTEDNPAIVVSHPNNEAEGEGLKISSATQIDRVGWHHHSRATKGMKTALDITQPTPPTESHQTKKNSVKIDCIHTPSREVLSRGVFHVYVN